MALNAQLPTSVITVVDISRLERELASLAEFTVQSHAREAGKQPKLPRTTPSLEELARANGFNLLEETDRQNLTALVKSIRTKAPVIHISFASDPSAAVLAKIINWFRSEVNSLILLQVGLQPSIAAGCIVRTPNKYFDMSLRNSFAKHSQMLIDRLEIGVTHRV